MPPILVARRAAASTLGHGRAGVPQRMSQTISPSTAVFLAIASVPRGVCVPDQTFLRESAPEFWQRLQDPNREELTDLVEWIGDGASAVGGSAAFHVVSLF